MIEHAISVFMAFFAIMNPIANTAAFAGLASEMSKQEQSLVAAKSIIFTFIIVVLFSILGKSIFQLFGITLPALRIAGGILVFLVGYHMLHGQGSKLHSADDKSKSDIAISPLAVPLLAGPGTIATAMSYSASEGWGEVTITIIAFAVLCVITYTCFIFSSRIMRYLGASGLSIVTRLMGLILSVVGVQMVIVGIKGAEILVLSSH